LPPREHFSYHLLGLVEEFYLVLNDKHLTATAEFVVDGLLDERHLILHLDDGSPTHIHPVGQEVDVIALQQGREGSDVRLLVDVDEEVGIGMECLHQAFQLGGICMG
jgi:hypothetical protein